MLIRPKELDLKVWNYYYNNHYGNQTFTVHGDAFSSSALPLFYNGIDQNLSSNVLS